MLVRKVHGAVCTRELNFLIFKLYEVCPTYTPIKVVKSRYATDQSQNTILPDLFYSTLNEKKNIFIDSNKFIGQSNLSAKFRGDIYNTAVVCSRLPELA